MYDKFFLTLFHLNLFLFLTKIHKSHAVVDWSFLPVEGVGPDLHASGLDILLTNVADLSILNEINGQMFCQCKASHSHIALRVLAPTSGA